MPRTVPSGIASLVGVSATRAPILLLKLALSGGAVYYSSAEAVSYGGNSYTANRIHRVGAFDCAYIDRKSSDAHQIEIEIDNLADNGSSTFPLTALNASQSFEDAKMTVHLYSPDAADAVAATWWGYARGVKFSGDGKYCTISGTFFWDGLDTQEPPLLLQQKGFSQQEAAGKTSEDSFDDALPVPLIYGAGAMRVWPVIYNHWIDGGNLHVEFVLSGTQSGVPFNASDVVASDFKIFGATPATTIEFYTGSQSSAPVNLTRFPENNAHTLCAFGYAVFPITDQIKDKIDGLRAQDIRALVQNGRPLVDTTIPSENAPLILRDIMRDPVFGTGLASTLFDTSVLTTTANYVGTRYQVRYELSKQRSFSELVQYILSDFHGFITFDDEKIQIRCKKNTESSVATFATIDSGQSGRKIHNDFVNVTIKDSSELVNQATLKYRRKTKNRRIVTLYDPNAQTRAGGTAKKVVELVTDEWDSGGLYDETQAQINQAIIVREEQNGNLFIDFEVPIWDGIGVSPGDVITVYSPDIINNGTNNLFRVTSQNIDHETCLIKFNCQVYKAAIYNDDASALGVDLLRGGEDTNAQGRAPDVTPVSLTVIDVVTNDTEGKDATLRATFTVPAYDPTTDQASGVFLENKISEVEIDWHYTDEAVHASRFGNSLKIVQQATAFQASIDFTVPFFKSRSVEAFFVSIGPNRARVPLGLIPDPTKVTTLTGILSASGATANVAATGSNFNANEYAQIEKEQLQVASKTSTTITFVNMAGVRTPQFGTASIAHPTGTEIAVIKQSYPSLIKSLAGPFFTYITVTLNSLVVGENGGVRALWTDVSPDNLEFYGVAWSTDADAGTNVAKLGSANPAWYTLNPLAPPSGVNVAFTNKQQHFLINQSLIGPIGTPVFVRIFARNGKRNYSPALSNLLNSAVGSTGTQPPTDAPSTPVSGDVISNSPTPGTGGLAKIVLRYYADATRTKTFSAVGTTQAVLIFDTGGGKLWKPVFNIEDGSVTFVDISITYALGGVLTWIGNRSWSAGGHKDGATSSIVIAAGGYATNAGLLTGLVGFFTPIDEKHGYVTYTYVQPNPPVLLSYIAVLRKLPGEASFTRVAKFDVQFEPGFLVPGSVTATTPVLHTKKALVQWQVVFGGADGSTVATAVFSSTTPDVDTGAPNNGTAITITHAAIKNGRHLIVRFVPPTLQMVSHVRNVLILHDNNATGTGRKFFEPATQTWVSTYSDGTTEIDLMKGGVTDIVTPISTVFVGGRTQLFVKIGVYNAFNGGSVTYSSDTGTAINSTGNGVEPVDKDSAVPDVSTLQGVFRYDGGKELLLECPLPSANMSTFTKAELAIQFQDSPGNVLGYLTRNSSGQYVVSGSEVFFDLGKESSFSLNIKKVSLKALVPTATKLFFYYYVSNGLGRSATHSNGRIIFIDIDIIDYLGNRSVPVTIDVGVSMYATQNLIDNGDFDKANAANTSNLDSWYKWQSGTVLNTTNVNQASTSARIRSATSGIAWSVTQHNVSISDGSFYLVRLIGKVLKPGVPISLSMLLRAAVNGWSPNVKAWIVKDNVVSSPGTLGANLDAANLLAAPLNIPTTAGLSSSIYTQAGNYQQCPVATSLGVAGVYPLLWLVIGVPAGFTTPHQLIIDRVKLNDGGQPSTFTPTIGETPGVSDPGSIGIIPGNVGTLPDANYLPSGDQGGYTAQGGIFA